MTASSVTKLGGTSGAHVSCWTYSGRNTCGLRTLGSWMQGKQACIQEWSQVLCFASDLLTIVVTAGSYVWSLTWFRLRPPHFPGLYLPASFIHLEEQQALFEWLNWFSIAVFFGSVPKVDGMMVFRHLILSMNWCNKFLQTRTLLI